MAMLHGGGLFARGFISALHFIWVFVSIHFKMIYVLSLINVMQPGCLFVAASLGCFDLRVLFVKCTCCETLVN